MCFSTLPLVGCGEKRGRWLSRGRDCLAWLAHLVWMELFMKSLSMSGLCLWLCFLPLTSFLLFNCVIFLFGREIWRETTTRVAGSPGRVKLGERVAVFEPSRFCSLYFFEVNGRNLIFSPELRTGVGYSSPVKKWHMELPNATAAWGRHPLAAFPGLFDLSGLFVTRGFGPIAVYRTLYRDRDLQQAFQNQFQNATAGGQGWNRMEMVRFRLLPVPLPWIQPWLLPWHILGGDQGPFPCLHCPSIREGLEWLLTANQALGLGWRLTEF